MFECDSIFVGSEDRKSWVTASSEYSSTYPGYKAFNGTSETGNYLERWLNDSSNPPNIDGSCYLDWVLDAPRTLNAIKINRSANASTENMPKDVKILGSHAGSFSGEEDVVCQGQIPDTVENAWSGWLEFDTPGAYQYYRVEIHTIWPYAGSSSLVCVQEVAFCEYTGPMGTEVIEDISLDLSAYYQARDNLAAILSATDGTILQDLSAILKIYGQSIDDLAAELAAYYQDRQDIAAVLKMLATGYKDLPTALQAMGLGRADLPAQLKALAWASRDLNTMLAAVTPLVFIDLGLSLSATDGTTINDLSTVLAAVKRAPQYRSVVAQRVRSVISEVI
jgi:hypothetical protein